MKISDLKPAVGSKKRKKRLGCGRSSGHGKTSTRGHKGQKSRGKGRFYEGFEGGQMPLQRRTPKRGFTNKFRKKIRILNIDSLNKFENGSMITIENLVKQGLVKNTKEKVKILGKGKIVKSLNINMKDFFMSASAKEKIEAVGGKIII
ncbi:MAG: 50S ribosomal protein L15 [bacterium]